jgi:hypothetical protein
VTWGELGVQNVESLILVDALFLLHWGRRREWKKKEKKSPWGVESFPWGGPALLAVQLLGAIQGSFEDQSLNFFPAPSVMTIIILARSCQNYLSMAPTSQRFMESWSLGFLLPLPNHHLGCPSHYNFDL